MPRQGGRDWLARADRASAVVEEKKHGTGGIPRATATKPPGDVKVAETAKWRQVGTDTKSVMSERQPIRMVVRRGALRRFNALKERTADLPVEVTWDRRQQKDRRNVSGDIARERRRADRRRTPPFTWDVADFLVVDEGEGER